MSKQRYINTRFWDDGYVAALDPIEKLLFIYCLTNPLTEISGAYELPLRRIAFDTGIDKDMVLKIFARFSENDKAHYRDGWIFMPNFIKHQSNSPKVAAGIETSLKSAPQWILDMVSIRYEDLSHLNLIKLNVSEVKTIPTPTPEVTFEPDRFNHPAVVEFESVFGFKAGSGFATSVARKVSNLGIWTTLLHNKRAYADKPIVERRKICNWILDEYDKRVKDAPKIQRLPTVEERQREEEANLQVALRPPPKPTTAGAAL